MEAHIKLGRILGVKVGLHFSWLIIALLIVFSLATRFQAMHADWGGVVIWATAIVTAALFFASIVVHELSHAMAARARGLPVRSITLFALGGVADIEKEASDAKSEFRIAIVGPIASAAIGLACLALAWVLGWTALDEPGTPLTAMLVWLGYINLALAAFNMIPGFPLDGGRVLRAIIWATTGDKARATRTAALTGQVIAFGFIAFGVARFFSGADLGGLWIAFIGWFLFGAAHASQAQASVIEALRGVRVSSLMTRHCPVVDGRVDIQTFVDEHLLRTGRRCFLIAENGLTTGLITPKEVKAIDRGRWSYTTVSEAMLPLAKLHLVLPETPVSEALEILAREDVNQLPVMYKGQLEGLISRDQVLQYLATRAELNG